MSEYTRNTAIRLLEVCIFFFIFFSESGQGYNNFLLQNTMLVNDFPLPDFFLQILGYNIFETNWRFGVDIIIVVGELMSFWFFNDYFFGFNKQLKA